jgi:DNA replication and repair protein RecF
LDLSCPEGFSVFHGENAQGKSNLLEAIYFISTGRSFRTNTLAELVQWGQQRFDIRCDVEFTGVSHRLEATVGEGRSKSLLDGKPRRGASVFGNFKAVVFANEDLDVVRQEPAVRRRFFDLFFAQIDETYGKHLEDYTRVVRNRNRLLKEERFAELEPWNTLLIREGSWLAWQRRKLLIEFEKSALTDHRGVSSQSEDLGIRYKASCDTSSPEAIQKGLAGKLADHREHEKILKTTLVGPHRDDYDIRIEGKAVRHFGSEGQKRSSMLSLRMAQWRFLKNRFDEPPMILLDDVMGELDQERQKGFLNLVSGTGAQAFIAITHVGKHLQRVASEVFKVSSGTLSTNKGLLVRQA